MTIKDIANMRLINQQVAISRLEKLAGKYFLSRGPATLQDFKWWSGLQAVDARNALESVKSRLIQINTGTDTTGWVIP